MTVAIGVQHELHPTVDTVHLVCSNLLRKDSSNLVVSRSNNCLDQLVHYLLLILLVICCLLHDHLNDLPQACYMGWLLNLLHFLHRSLEELILSRGKSGLRLSLLIDAILAKALTHVGSALGAPLTSSTHKWFVSHT